MRIQLPTAGAVVLAFLLSNIVTGTIPYAAAEEAAPGFQAMADKNLPAGGTLRVYLDYDTVAAAGLDPRVATTARSWMIMGLSYETLVKVDEKFGFIPGLAKSWKIVSPTEYVFELREDAVFSNGRPMTSEDVKGSIEMLQESKSSWALQLGPIASVDITGPHQVTIRLSAPYTALLGALANTPAAILPVKEARAGTVDLSKQMVGTGPYVATAHVQDESWTFTKNPHHPNAAKIGIDTIDIEIVADEANRLAAIRDGSAHYAFFNNADALDLLGGSPQARVVKQQNTDFYYLILNSKNPASPLRDERVRLAVNAAIDRVQLSDLTLAGYGLTTGVTPVTLPGACDPAKLPSATLSDDEISKLLTDAGATNIKLSLTTWNEESAPAQIAQIIQQQLQRFGITVDIKVVDDPTYVAEFYGSDQPATADIGISWYAGYGDAAMVSRWWNTEQATFTARYMTGSPELNALVVKASQEPQGASRDQVLTELCAAVDKGAEQVPLMTRPGVIAYRTDKVSPTINTNEGYGNLLRYITDFRLTGTK